MPSDEVKELLDKLTDKVDLDLDLSSIDLDPSVIGLDEESLIQDAKTYLAASGILNTLNTIKEMNAVLPDVRDALFGKSSPLSESVTPDGTLLTREFAANPQWEQIGNYEMIVHGQNLDPKALDSSGIFEKIVFRFPAADDDQSFQLEIDVSIELTDGWFSSFELGDAFVVLGDYRIQIDNQLLLNDATGDLQSGLQIGTDFIDLSTFDLNNDGSVDLGDLAAAFGVELAKEELKELKELIKFEELQGAGDLGSKNIYIGSGSGEIAGNISLSDLFNSLENQSDDFLG